MRLEDMKYFVEIVKAKSINQASKTLFVAQPALSRMLAALEKELGFSLLERSKQGIVPTKAGLEVYADCIKMLALYNDCTHRWQDLAYACTDHDTVVRIVALPMICNTTMNRVFYEAAQKYPRIRLELFETQLPDILQKTVAQPKTIGFSHYTPQTKDGVYTFAKTHQMQIIPLFDDQYIFFASCDCPLVGKILTDADLKPYTLASYSNLESSKIVMQNTNFISKFKQVFYLSNKDAIMETTANNQAISSSAAIMSRDNIYRRTGRVKPLHLDSIYLPITYFLLFSHTATTEEKIVVDLLCSHYLALADEA